MGIHQLCWRTNLFRSTRTCYSPKTLKCNFMGWILARYDTKIENVFRGLCWVWYESDFWAWLGDISSTRQGIIWVTQCYFHWKYRRIARTWLCKITISKPSRMILALQDYWVKMVVPSNRYGSGRKFLHPRHVFVHSVPSQSRPSAYVLTHVQRTVATVKTRTVAALLPIPSGLKPSPAKSGELPAIEVLG